MTVSQLIKELERIENKNLEVVLGVEGYTTIEDDSAAPIGLEATDSFLFVCDGCFYEEVDG